MTVQYQMTAATYLKVYTNIISIIVSKI